MFSKVAESAQKMTFFYVGIMIVLASVVAQCILLLVYAELAYHSMERIESHAVCISFVLCIDFVHVHTCFFVLATSIYEMQIIFLFGSTC